MIDQKISKKLNSLANCSLKCFIHCPKIRFSIKNFFIFCAVITIWFLTYNLINESPADYTDLSDNDYLKLTTAWKVSKYEVISSPYFLLFGLNTNELRYITLVVVSGSIKKLFSISFVNIYLFLIFFSIDFARWKNVKLPYFTYIVIH